MMMMRRISLGGGLLALVTMLLAGCVLVPPHEGYFDRAHQRYWHNHAWHACVVNDAHCR